MRISDGKTIFGAAVVLALAVYAQSAFAEDRPSARIYSLGGELVSGIIPDLYTDLSINPAYANYADRLTLNYGRRNSSLFDMAFPYLTTNTYSSVSSNGSGANEISLYGIRIRGWQTAFDVQWLLDGSENSTSRSELGADSNPYLRVAQSYYSDDGDLGRISLAAARPVGGSVLGFRLQGRGGYDSYSSASSRETELYSNSSFMEIRRRETQHSGSSQLGRQFCFDLQSGIASGDGPGLGTELVLSASYRTLDYERQTYSLNVTRYYDAAGDLNNYYHDQGSWSDKREGDVWSYGLSALHTFRGGIRVYSGATLSTASYDAQWADSEKYIDWNLASGGSTLSGDFTGDGSVREASCFLKGGKKLGLHRTLDLFVGFYGSLQRTQAEENPVIHYAQSLVDGGSILIDQPSTFKSTATGLDLHVPLSIEFRPSSYFSFFSGFTIGGHWHKNVTEHPALSLFYYQRPHTATVPGGASRTAASGQATVYPETSVEDWDRDWYTTHTTTLGFSLHYRDRFFIDVYTASEIIPSSLGSNILDIRYVF
jgi:hypothetical protein